LSKRNVRSKKLSTLVFGALLLVVLAFSIQVPQVAAQTQYISATPGYINLGMNTTISVTGPAAGSYSLIVLKPSGAKLQLNESFTSAGQVQTAVFGNSTSGFMSLADQVGTYNVFLEQGTTVVSSTSFYATNKLVVNMDMVNGGTCIYVAGVTRGVKMFPRFYLTYASTGGKITNSDKGISVVFTQPGNTKANASWDPFAKLFVGKVFANWNYTNVGPWNPTAVVSDAAGNAGSFNYTGSPYVISPAILSTTIQLVDSKTNKTITSIATGENVTIYATISYPTNPEPVTGFVAPLDATVRGGVATGILGYGTYNATSQSFAGKNSGQVTKLPLTYSGKNGVWVGSFNAGTLPTLNSSQTFEVVVNSADSASPPNTGSNILNVAPSAALTTVTTSSSHTTQSSSTTSPAITTSIPVWAYAGTTIALIIGVIVGFLARKR
jgi:hypothetical protein